MQGTTEPDTSWTWWAKGFILYPSQGTAAAASPRSCLASVVWCLQTCVCHCHPFPCCQLVSSNLPARCHVFRRWQEHWDRLIHCMSEIQAAKIFCLRCLFCLLFFSLTYSSYSRHLTSLADENKKKIIKATQRPIQSSLQAKVAVANSLFSPHGASKATAACSLSSQCHQSNWDKEEPLFTFIHTTVSS